MDVQLGNTNTDQGTRFPQARIGGASGFVIPVPEPGTLSLIGLAFAGVGWARRRKPNWQQATEKKKTKMKLDS
jgi:CO dehydrogenase/acetyl-CoA synthase delta subunit